MWKGVEKISKKDIGVFRYFEDNERYADLVNGYVFQGKQVVTAEDVQEMDSRVTAVTQIPEEQKIAYTQQFRDFVRKTIFGVGCVIVAVENQDKIHYAMPLRVLMEETKEYEKQWRKIRNQHKDDNDLKNGEEFLGKFSKEDSLHAVVSLIVYYGKKPWDGPKDLYEMLELEDIPEEMRQLVNRYPMHVLEVRRFENTEWFQTDLRDVFEVIQHADNKQSLKKFVEENEERLNNMAQDACELIAVVTGTPEFAFHEKRYESEVGNVKMCDGMREWLEEKYETGYTEGQACKLIELICKKLRKGKAVEQIAQELEEELDIIQEICDLAAPFVPGYDLEKVLDVWFKGKGITD